jgi:large conductance mechanosensitive channel
MGMLKEFKDFAMRGSLVEIAVAFVMGGAFGKVITSFTDGLVAPLVGLISGKDLSENMMVLKKGVAEVKDAAGNITTAAQAEVALKWGAFVTSVIDFVIVAFVMFLIIKALNSMKKKEVTAPAAPPEDITLLREIRDALKK